MRQRCPVRQGWSLASARDRPPFCSVSRDAHRGAALRACAARAPDAATATTSVGSPFGDSPIPSARRSSISVAADASLFSACPIGHYGRPPGPADRPPGSIPPGAASPRPAPRSPLRGLRRPGDDPWRLRSLTLAARCACRCRRQDPVLPPPLPGRFAPIAGGFPRTSPTRIAVRRFAPPPLAPLSPPFGGSPATPTSQQARRLRAIAVARGLSQYRPVRMPATAHRSSSDIALSRPALRAMALRRARPLPPKPWHSPRTSRPSVPAARPCR